MPECIHGTQEHGCVICAIEQQTAQIIEALKQLFEKHLPITPKHGDKDKE